MRAEKGKADRASRSCMNGMTAFDGAGNNQGVDDNGGRVLAFPQAPEAIELRHLRSFVAVAEDLNFGRAAARLYLSQPALSRQISALERLVGCELLRRSTHRVELTLAGEALLDRARRLLQDVDEAVAATQSIGGEIAARLARLWEPLETAANSDAELHELRAAYETLHANFAVPPEVAVRPVNAGGVHSLLVGRQPDEPATLLYLHGGGYVLGSAFGYRPLAGALAMAAETTALVPDYRLAPEHPFPAAVDDALHAYLWMLDQGTDPQRVTVAGDSSGGGLAVSLLLRLKERSLPMPAGAMLLCPGVALAGAAPDADASERALAIEQVRRRCADAYLAGHPIDDPVVSPLTADLSGLPPMLVQAATGDDYVAEARELADRARGHGVDARLELYPVDTHVFQLFWSFLPEAAEAIHEAGRFARAAVHGDRVAEPG
jgi:monoterpene epsilon-lactone hydrolase